MPYSSVRGRCADAAPLSASRPRASASSGGSGKWRRPTSVVTITHSVRPTMRASYASEACRTRSEEHTSELQSQSNLVCRLLLEKKKITRSQYTHYDKDHSLHVH